jgi:hypothetical protein
MKPSGSTAALCLALLACSETHVFRSAELLRLQPGFDHHMRDDRGQDVSIRPETLMIFHLRDGGTVHGQFASIEIVGGTFVGHTIDGKTITLRTSVIESVTVERFSAGRTVGFVVLGFLVFVIVVLVALAIFDAACGPNCLAQ